MSPRPIVMSQAAWTYTSTQQEKGLGPPLPPGGTTLIPFPHGHATETEDR